MLSKMRPEMRKGILDHLKTIGSFQDAKILELAPGHAKLSIPITEDAFNLYGHVHGGFLFSICDAVSGMATYCYELNNVTQCCSLNYLRKVQSGTIYVEARELHKGRKTAVNHLTISDDQGRMVAAGQFTMFLGEPI